MSSLENWGSGLENWDDSVHWQTVLWSFDILTFNTGNGGYNATYIRIYDSLWRHVVFSPELDASAEEKEILDLTGRLLSVIATKDIKEYSLVSSFLLCVLETT